MIRDEEWPVARLIPISSASGIEAQERRAASALLAVMGSVPEFGRALLRPVGAPSGRIEAFIEVPFKLRDQTIRPDGILAVTRGGKSWRAIVETKVGSTHLAPQQVDSYLDLARELEFDAVLSISNHYVTSSTEYPVPVDRRKLRKVALHHWSWIDVLTEAVVQRRHRGVSDPDQAYILNELIRYLSDPRSGAVSLDSMGPNWARVRDGTRDRTLRKNDREVAAVAARWDDLVRYLALDLTQVLGREVRTVVARAEKVASARLSALRDSLAETGRLYAELHVPDAAAAMRIVADLRARQVLISTRIDAPREGRSKGKVSWLLRQLKDAPENLRVEAKAARSPETVTASLQEAREDPALLYPLAGREIRQFEMTAMRNMGLKGKAGRGSFINSVLEAAREFYASILQNLRAWKPPPPRLPTVEQAEAKEKVPLPSGVEEAIQDAEEEMGNVRSDSLVEEMDSGDTAVRNQPAS